MPRYTIQGPSGKTYEIEGPEGASADQIGQFILQNSPDERAALQAQKGRKEAAKRPPPTLFSDPAEQYSYEATKAQAVPVAGAVRGVADVGNTLVNAAAKLAPEGSAVDQWNKDRQASLQDFDSQFADDPAAQASYAGGRLAGNALATAPVGGVLAKVIGRAPLVSPKLVSAIGSGGTTLGAPKAATFAGQVADLLTRSAGGAITGGASAALIDPDTAGTGAVIGALLPGAISGAGAVGDRIRRGAASFADQIGDTVRAFRDPQAQAARAIAGKLGDDVGDVVAALRSAPEIVPGSRATSAQAAANPTLVQLEKAAANNPDIKNALMMRANQNNAARMAALQEVAKTPDDLAAAIAARKDAAAPAIDKLLTNPKTSAPVPIKPILRELDKLENSGLGTDPVVKRAIGQLRAQLEEGASRTDLGAFTLTPSQLKNLRPGNPAIRPDLLDGYRQNVRNFLKDNASNGVVASRQEAAFEPIKQKIIDAIEGANPGYRRYLQQYASDSAPINTMESGQELLDAFRTGTLNSTGEVAPALGTYRGKLAQVMRGNDFPIEPQANNKLSAILEDLQRESISNSVRVPGSDTAYNLNADSWLGKALAGGRMGRMAGAAAGTAVGGPVVGTYAGYKGAEALQSAARSRLNNALTELLMDPEALANALAAQPAARSFSAGAAAIPADEPNQILQLLMRAAPVSGASLSR